MKTFLVSSAILTTLLTGCSDTTSVQDDKVKKEVSVAKAETKQLVPNLKVEQKASSVYLNYTIKNNMKKKVDFKFDTNEEFTYKFIDEKGKVVKNLSEERKIIKQSKTVSLNDTDVLSFELFVNGLKEGKYTVEFYFKGVPVGVNEKIDPVVVKNVSVKTPDYSKEERVEGVFNGWVDSHSVEVQVGDMAEVYQIKPELVEAITKNWIEGSKVTFNVKKEAVSGKDVSSTIVSVLTDL